MSLVTLKVFQNAIEAHLIKSKLEAEGIPCVLFDENITTLAPFYSLVSGGIQLKISSLDVEAADEVLKEIASSKYTNEQGETLHCPNCHSEDFYSDFKSSKSKINLFSWFSAIFFGSTMSFDNGVYKCKNCNTEFDNN